MSTQDPRSCHFISSQQILLQIHGHCLADFAPNGAVTNGPALLEMGISPFLVFVAGRQDMVEVEEAFHTKVQDLFKEEGLVYPDFRRLFGGADRISLSAFAPPAKSFFLPPPAKPRSPFRTSPLS
jgi:hypothetical protein